jgi:hypothetical protein
MAVKAIYLIVRTWTNDDGVYVSGPYAEEAFEDEDDAKAYLAAHPDGRRFTSRIKRIDMHLSSRT